MLNLVQNSLTVYYALMGNFFDDGLNFECQRCSFCCGHSPGFVYLSRRDLLELCSFFNMKVKDFVNTYCRWADYYYGTTVIALKEQKNFDCILWKNGCTAYKARPLQCSTYPFWSWMISDRQTWDQCGKECPGINKGKKWDKETILQQKKIYDENKPLYKEEVIKMFEEEGFMNSENKSPSSDGGNSSTDENAAD